MKRLPKHLRSFLAARFTYSINGDVRTLSQGCQTVKFDGTLRDLRRKKKRLAAEADKALALFWGKPETKRKLWNKGQ